ncbi:PGPGW domain-containing protein [Sandarakinorhabdus sp. DWP1-3-1]|uniref:PGPGW domain-containing protein n=1 Tax=Sandarakinorhabdus sp. DWP1-3-1 TaxID=2804627 RepID=UPI003CF3BB9B
MKRPAFLDVLIRSEPFRVFQLMLGAFLMLVAPIIGIPTPGPLGIFVFAFGLALVLRNSAWARRRYVRYTRRYPRVQKAVNFGLRRKSKRKPATPPLGPLPPPLDRR